jgi:hypothetical protein
MGGWRSSSAEHGRGVLEMAGEESRCACWALGAGRWLLVTLAIAGPAVLAMWAVVSREYQAVNTEP